MRWLSQEGDGWSVAGTAVLHGELGHHGRLPDAGRADQRHDGAGHVAFERATETSQRRHSSACRLLAKSLAHFGWAGAPRGCDIAPVSSSPTPCDVKAWSRSSIEALRQRRRSTAAAARERATRPEISGELAAHFSHLGDMPGSAARGSSALRGLGGSGRDRRVRTGSCDGGEDHLVGAEMPRLRLGLARAVTSMASSPISWRARRMADSTVPA